MNPNLNYDNMICSVYDLMEMPFIIINCVLNVGVPPFPIVPQVDSKHVEEGRCRIISAASEFMMGYTNSGVLINCLQELYNYNYTEL